MYSANNSSGLDSLFDNSSTGNRSNSTGIEAVILPAGLTILKIVLLTAYIGIAVCGSVGNILSFIVMHWRSRKSAINLLLLYLAVVDTIFLIFAILHSAFPGKEGDCQKLLSSIIQTYVIPGTLTITQFLSVWTIVILGVFRYVAICKPFFASHICSQTRAKCALVMTLFGGVLLWSPYIFRQRLVQKKDNETSCYSVEMREWTSAASFRYYDGFVAHLGTMFVIPLLLLLFFNGHMMAELYCMGHKHTNLSKRSNSQSSQHQLYMDKLSRDTKEVSKVVIAIIVVFFVSYSMYGAFILYEMNLLDGLSTYAKEIFLFAIRTVALLNSSVNFVIYYILRKSFRKKTKQFIADQVDSVLKFCKQAQFTSLNSLDMVNV